MDAVGNVLAGTEMPLLSTKVQQVSGLLRLCPEFADLHLRKGGAPSVRWQRGSTGQDAICGVKSATICGMP